MTTWLDKAKRYKTRQEETLRSLEQTAREVAERFDALKIRMQTISVWALLPIGDEIQAGQTVWYLGKWYTARKTLKKVLTEPPAVGECWEEWSAE